MDNRLLIIFFNGNESTLAILKQDLASKNELLHAELLKLPNSLSPQLQQASCDKTIYISANADQRNGKQLAGKSQEINVTGFQMYNAFLQAFSKGYNSVCLIDGLHTELSSEIVDRAFVRLRDFEVVLGPTLEGGCYLLGMSHIQPMLFNRPDWNETTFIKEIIKEIRPAKLSISLLPVLAETVAT